MKFKLILIVLVAIIVFCLIRMLYTNSTELVNANLAVANHRALYVSILPETELNKEEVWNVAQKLKNDLKIQRKLKSEQNALLYGIIGVTLFLFTMFLFVESASRDDLIERKYSKTKRKSRHMIDVGD